MLYILYCVFCQTEEECTPKDPLNESNEESGQLTDRKPTVDVIEEFLPPDDVLSGSSEQTYFQPASNEEIDLEMLNNGMQFECVRKK